MHVRYKIFQTYLVHTGKLPGPFQVKYFGLTDLDGNPIEIPLYTAISLFLSGLSIIKACADLNVVRIHVEDDYEFGDYARKVFVHLPFMLTSGFFAIYSISILITYVNVWVIIPIPIVLMANLIYSRKKYGFFYF